MPQDITINGAQYPDVPAVQIPKTGGGTAQFDDTTDATATASEIASGKTAYVNNTRLVGTGQMVEPPLYIDPSINGVGIGATPENDHELTIANGYHINAKGKYNTFTYMPYSAVVHGTNGTAGYAKIATISVIGTWAYSAIEFDVVRAFDTGATRYSLYYETGSGTTPTSIYFVHDSFGKAYKTILPEAFVVKSSSTLEVYVRKCTDSDIITVTTYASRRQQDRVNITYSEGQYNTIPSGAVMATPVTCLNPTVTVTKTGGLGELNTATLYRSGNVVQLRITVHTTSAVAVGATLLSLTTNAPRPVSYVTATEITGNYVGVGWLNTDGTFSSREAVGEVPTNRYFTFTFTYLTND